MSEPNGSNRRPQFTLSIETQLIADRLSAVAMGEQVSYDELSKIAGSNVREDRGALESARRVVLREHGIVFDVVRGSGLIRLDDNAIIESRARDVRHINRAAHKAMVKQSKANYESLTPENKLAFNTTGSLLKLVSIASSRDANKRMRIAVTAANQQLSLAQSLEALKGG